MMMGVDVYIRFGVAWPEISSIVGVMTRVDATSLEVMSTLVLDCSWGWGLGRTALRRSGP